MKKITFLLLAMVILTGFVSAQTTANPFEVNNLEAAMSENNKDCFVVNSDSVSTEISRYYAETSVDLYKTDKYEMITVSRAQRFNTGQKLSCECFRLTRL